jgi:hypothetical protein
MLLAILSERQALSAPAVAAARTAWRYRPPAIAGGLFSLKGIEGVEGIEVLKGGDRGQRTSTPTLDSLDPLDPLDPL